MYRHQDDRMNPGSHKPKAMRHTLFEMNKNTFIHLLNIQ